MTMSASPQEQASYSDRHTDAQAGEQLIRELARI